MTLLFLIFIVDTLTGSLRSLSKAKKILKSRSKTFKLLESQSTAVCSHASSYSNTLGADGAKLLIELSEIVTEQKNILDSLQLATTNWDIDEISRIEEEPTISDKQLFVAKLKRAETIIGYLSARLAEASMSATKLHIPKIKKPQSTIEGLSMAGLASIPNPNSPKK